MSVLGSGGAFATVLERLGSSEIAGHLMQALGPQVVQTILDQLNRQGYGPQVNSWLGRGANQRLQNQPLTADEIRSALGDARLQEVARQLGLPIDRLGPILAQHLPAAVEHGAQSGAIPSGAPS